MRVLLQRVSEASVFVNNDVCGSINKGLVLLVGFCDGDTSLIIDYMVDKVINLRIFNDENMVMNRSLVDVGGSILLVSQFTLYADTRKGRRPGYSRAMKGEFADKLYEEFKKKLMDKGVMVESGVFGSDMKVQLVNDGPVTIMLERENDDGEE